MKAFLLLFTTFLSPTLITTVYTPSTNFCKLKCDNEKNVACNCKVLGRRKEDLSDLTKFRKHILEVHNDLRNHVAGGIALGPSQITSNTSYLHFLPASNINVLSYDLELEHVARCYAVKHVFHRDQCRRTSKFRNPGQFVAGFRKKPSIEEIKQFVTDVFYEQVKYVNVSTIENYRGYRSGIGSQIIEDFAQMTWWSHTHLGCGRAYNPEAVFEADKYVVVCNYGGSKDSNDIGKMVYKKGAACTQCDNNRNCSKVYKKLCGNMEVVPTDSVKSIPSGQVVVRESMIFILIGCLCHVLFKIV